ncbi:MAG TPA: pilus assembly protein PilY, partial [Gammaproteobacteria bacterium]|nr:pilus assembly protein PilY [Gammaproteobacteria bacterium]
VSVNAFNRLTNRNDLYFALFRPTINYRWPGNLKKYQLVRAVSGDPSSNLIIADVNGNSAVDSSTGLFLSTAQSFWSGSVDGADIKKGGAAEQLPAPASRRIYTYTGTDSALLPPQTASITLESTKNKLLDSNTALTKSMLGLPSTATASDRTSLIQWARGVDVLDENGNGSTTDSRNAIGDPLHSQPQLVTYKGTTDADADITLYMTTNQGFLHAIDAKTGVEQFAFIPKDLLSNLPRLEGNTTTTTRLYGLDGPMTIWHNDLNNDLLVLNPDGTVETGEHVYLYFGMRRGGRNYYALDVTDRSSPKLKWEIKGGTGDFAELGQTWSKMIHAKIKFNGADRDVLIFGGGYDANIDSTTLPTTDSMGRALYIVDAKTGKRLWWASTGSSNANLKLADMKNAIAANVTAFDSNGDGYVDRIYAADMGARIWRFDINKNNTGAANLMTGGVIADLNGTATNVPSNEAAANNRHFFSAPDVAYVRQGSQEYLTIAIGSGFRAHPLESTIQDRFYVIRDTNVRGPAKDANGNAIYTTITENDLYDATKNLAGEGTQTQIDAARQALNTNDGWYIKLNQDNGTFIGEKVLSKSVTFNNILIFTSFTPTTSAQSNSCAPGKGTSSAWAINLLDAAPVFNFCNNGSLERCDRKGVLNITGLPPSPSVIFPKDGGTTIVVGTKIIKDKNNKDVEPVSSNFYTMDYWNIK